MFRCQLCGTVMPPGTRTHKLIVQTRAKKYEPREKPQSRGGGGFRGRGGRPTRRRLMDPGGEGREIVRELSVCAECAEKYAPTPEPEPVVEPAVATESTEV